MDTPAIIGITALVVVSGAVPFVRVLRGSKLKPAIGTGWALFVLFSFLFSFVGPIAARQISRELADTVSRGVPEGGAVIGFICFGWLYAAVIVGLAWLIRFIFLRLRGAPTQ